MLIPHFETDRPEFIPNRFRFFDMLLEGEAPLELHKKALDLYNNHVTSIEFLMSIVQLANQELQALDNDTDVKVSEDIQSKIRNLQTYLLTFSDPISPFSL